MWMPRQFTTSAFWPHRGGKEECGSVSATAIWNCWEQGFKEEVSSYSPGTIAGQEELETAVRAAAIMHSVSFTLVNIQSLLNLTDKANLVEGFSWDILLYPCVCPGKKTAMFVTYMRTIMTVQFSTCIISIKLRLNLCRYLRIVTCWVRTSNDSDSHARESSGRRNVRLQLRWTWGAFFFKFWPVLALVIASPQAWKSSRQLSMLNARKNCVIWHARYALV